MLNPFIDIAIGDQRPVEFVDVTPPMGTGVLQLRRPCPGRRCRRRAPSGADLKALDHAARHEWAVQFGLRPAAVHLAL